MGTYVATYVIGAPEMMDEHRPAHRAYLNGLADAGSLKVSGLWEPQQGETLSSMLIFTADGIEQAQKFAEDDPFVSEGVVSAVSVRQWNPVLGYLKDEFP